MKITIALIFTSLIMLQACGSKGRMMHSETSVDKAEVVLVAINQQ